MRFVRVVPVLALLWAPPQDAARAPDCGNWQTCRQRALEAAERQDFDAFHDLAWRAFRAGPKTDPALMTLVARAQSLSGRPHDALVMLKRLADMAVVTDAATSDDFARVRALPGWADFEARLAGKSPAGDVSSPGVSVKTEDRPAVKEKAATPSAPKAESPAPPTPSPSGPLSLPRSEIEPSGLAYDAVSGRFIVGDKIGRKLAVIGERSRRLANYAGVDGGLGDITAFEIDTGEGDLWVVSSDAVHKLQLISGRILMSVPVPADIDGPRFTDVAVTGSAVLVLDAAGRRLFRVTRKGRSLELVARLAASEPASVAPVSETVAYVAYDRGVVRVDLTSRTLTVVEPSRRVELGGLSWIRWHRGALVGIQGAADGERRVVRIKLDGSGRLATGLETLGDAERVAGPTSATLAGNVLYVLRTAPDSPDAIVGRHVLK